jgi:hypothetical protein
MDQGEKEMIMIDALSTRNRIKTLILLGISCFSAIASVIVGIDDNPPGALLALLAAMAFILAFCHPWRTTRKFMLLLLAAVLGFVLLVIVSILSDSIVQNPASPAVLQNMIQGPVIEVLTIIFVMLCAAAFIVGVVGSVGMLIRSRILKT